MRTMGELKGLHKRLQKLQTNVGSNNVCLTLADGTHRYMKIQTLFTTFANSAVGTTTPETEIILASVSDNSGTKLAELLKALTTGEKQ